MRKRFLLLLIALVAVTRAEANDACQADFDGNGIVDFADFLLFNGLYGQRGGEQCAMTVDADSLAVVTALRDSIVALQAALGATRFAVVQLQNTLASETERANENQRLLTASNDAFNSLAQTRCPENEPAAQPEPPVPAPQPEPEPPVVIETQPEPEPPPVPEQAGRLADHSLAFEATTDTTTADNPLGYWILDIKVSVNGFSGPVSHIRLTVYISALAQDIRITPPPGGLGRQEPGIATLWFEPPQELDNGHIANIRIFSTPDNVRYWANQANTHEMRVDAAILRSDGTGAWAWYQLFRFDDHFGLGNR